MISIILAIIIQIALPTISMSSAMATPSLMSFLRSSICLTPGFFFNCEFTHAT